LRAAKKSSQSFRRKGIEQWRLDDKEALPEGFVYMDGDKWKGRYREDLITGTNAHSAGSHYIAQDSIYS